MSRRAAPTHREVVLRLLREAGARGVTTSEFLNLRISRFGARVRELRQEGHQISTVRVRAGESRYTLLREPQAAPPPAPSAQPGHQQAPDAPRTLFGVPLGQPTIGYGQDV